MNIDVLKGIIHYYHNIDRLPIALYDHQKPEEYYITNREVLSLFSTPIETILKSEHAFYTMVFMDYIIFYKIKVLNTSYQLIIGPLPLRSISNAMIRAYMVDQNTPFEFYDSIQSFFNFTPVLTYNHYQSKMNLLYMSINHTMISSNDSFVNENAISEVMLARVKHSYIEPEDVNLPKKTKLLNYEYENKMIYYVENGLMNQMDKFEKLYYSGDVKVISEDPLRNAKLSLATMNSLCLRAAIRGGVNFDIAYEMGDFFSVTIENAKKLEELSPISYAIRRDYCRKVHDAKNINVEDASIRKCIAYIQQNITKNFTIKELADYVGFSKSYLSSKFAQVVGKTFSQYLLEAKMNVAKELLVLTDRTIVDISFFLSFSSQSYFNNQFKKIAGITPQQFRVKNKNGSSIANK